MTTGLWVTQIWLESQFCMVTSPPMEKGLELLSQSGVTLPLREVLCVLALSQ